MTLSSLGRASAIGVAISLVAGCGGSSQSQSSIPSTPAEVQPNGHGKTHAHPQSASGNLLYATRGCGGTCILTYPSLELVGQIPGGGVAICSDSQGNIFLPDGSKIVEYAHGGTSPIATLTIPGTIADGCAVDPLTGTLAVVFQAQVAIFRHETGSPTIYDTNIDATYCTYDNAGNLFVDGYGGNSGAEVALAQLASGSSEFTTISVDNSVGNPGQIQWYGTYLVYQDYTKYGKLSELEISGSTAVIVATITLKGIKHQVTPLWLFDGKITVPYDPRGRHVNAIGIWNFPNAKRATKTIKDFAPFKKRDIDFAGVAVSVQPPSK